MDHRKDQNGKVLHRFMFVNLTKYPIDHLVRLFADSSNSENYSIFRGVIGIDKFIFIPDLIILYSLSFTPWSPLSEAEIIMSQVPGVPVVVMTDSGDLSSFRACYACGIKGVLHTSMEVKAAQQALQLIACGGTFIPANKLHS